MGKIIWISIGVGALLIMVVVAVIIVMKCVSAQHKKTLQESSVSQTSQAKEMGFTNKIHTESAWLVWSMIQSNFIHINSSFERLKTMLQIGFNYSMKGYNLLNMVY